MRPELQRGFDAIEQQRDGLQRVALALSDAQWIWTPDAKMWSVGQIIEHLALSDETLGQARAADAVQREDPMFRVVPRRLRLTMILGAFRRDIVLPLPSPAVEPRGDTPPSPLIARWTAARDAMRRALEDMSGEERSYGHPVLGPLTAVEMLELSQTHTAYHRRQLERLRLDAAFP